MALTTQQKILLMIQSETRPTDIARELGTSKQSVNQHLQKLQLSRLVKRAYPYKLTPRGRVVVNPITKINIST